MRIKNIIIKQSAHQIREQNYFYRYVRTNI